MLNKAYVHSFCLLPCTKRKCRQKILTRTTVLSSASGPSAAILAKCPVISLAHWLTVEILFTIISPCSIYRSKASLGIQQRLKSRGSSTKFYTGRLRPEVQPLNLLCTIFNRKGTPSYTFYWQWYLFHMPSLEHCIPLSCCICTVFKIWINHKTRPFTQLFPQACNASVSPFWAFYQPKRQYPFIYCNKWNLNPLIYLKPENGIPFRWSLSVYVILGSTPRDSSRLWILINNTVDSR